MNTLVFKYTVSLCAYKVSNGGAEEQKFAIDFALGYNQRLYTYFDSDSDLFWKIE